jgi:cytosine/adenosine deaminase-related metal-dependent hydrolase
LHLASAVADLQGRVFQPGAVSAVNGRADAFGTPADLLRQYGHQAQRIDHGAVLLTPGHINAHTHLSLTAIGPQPFDPARQSFIDWILTIPSLLASAIEHGTGIPQAAATGAQLARAAGVEAVGDITLRQEAFEAVESIASTGMLGTCFIELLSPSQRTSPPEVQRLMRVATSPRKVQGMMLGLQPHAPYSTLPMLYASAVAVAVNSQRPLCTHLAETLEEAEFVAQGTGAFRDLLETLGQWSDDLLHHYRDGLSPVRWMEPYLRHESSMSPFGGWVLAHCNYVNDDDIALLAERGVSVVYCPIASEYFGHRAHRYRDMLEAGVNVCLGTDSILCASPDGAQPLGLMSAMRRLYQRDGTDPALLLRMATQHGRSALQLHEPPTTLAAIAINPDDDAPALDQIMRSNAPATPVML